MNWRAFQYDRALEPIGYNLVASSCQSQCGEKPLPAKSRAAATKVTLPTTWCYCTGRAVPVCRDGAGMSTIKLIITLCTRIRQHAGIMSCPSDGREAPVFLYAGETSRISDGFGDRAAESLTSHSAGVKSF